MRAEVQAGQWKQGGGQVLSIKPARCCNHGKKRWISRDPPIFGNGGARHPEAAVVEFPLTAAAISNRLPCAGKIFVTTIRPYPEGAHTLDSQAVAGVSGVLCLKGSVRLVRYGPQN